MRVAALGDNCFDVYPRLKKSYPTGNAVDFAVHMNRLGIPTSLISYTGNDEYGQQMVDAMSQEGIDLSHFHVMNGATAITYMDLIEKDRIHGDYIEGVLESMAFTDEDIQFAASHQLVHTAFWGKADNHLKRIKELGSQISFDYATKLDDPLVERTLPDVDYAFFSYAHPRDSSIESFLQDVTGKGPKIAVATFGSNGSLAFDGSEFYEFGVFEAQVVNTVGAGDSFIAGFMYGILQGKSIEHSLEIGAKIAAQVVGFFEPWEVR